MSALALKGRDNARTPMQWDAGPHAGFTTGVPWLPANPNHVELNAAAALADPSSAFHHYRALIALPQAALHGWMLLATYRFALADSTEVGRGQSAAAFTVPAHDSTTVQLPVDVSWQGLRAAARDASRDGTVDYRLTGSVTLDTPLGDPNVPFDAVGKFTPPPSLLRSFP